MKNIKFGYARVSTKGQSLDGQVEALKQANCEKIYTDVASTRGKLPELEKLIEHLRTGDTVVVWKIDRLGRSVSSLIKTIETLADKEIELISLTQHIDTKTKEGKFFFHMLASFAEMERDLISERTKIGLEVARSRGIKGGRPNKLDAKQISKLKKMYASKSFSISEICKTFDISRQTCYNYLFMY